MTSIANQPVRALKPENILKIRGMILSNPEAFDMGDFIDSSEVEDQADDQEYELTGHEVVEMVINQPDCGTTACIAGWATILAHHEHPEAYPVSMGMMPWEYVQKAADYMGLDTWSALELFFAAKRNEDGETLTQWTLADITVEDAAETLSRLAQTGKIDWSHLTQEPVAKHRDMRHVFGTSTLVKLGLIPDPNVVEKD